MCIIKMECNPFKAHVNTEGVNPQDINNPKLLEVIG